MSAAPYYYVCDGCGTMDSQSHVAEGDKWTCERCGSHAAWEFPPERRAAAAEHSAHIERGIGKGGIFRTARGRVMAP